VAGDLPRARRGAYAAIAHLAVVVLGCTHDFDDLLAGSSSAGAGVDASSTTGAGGKPSASSATSGGMADGGTGGRDPGSGGSVSSASTGGSGGSSEPGAVNYGASVADCIDTSAPNPDNCAAEAGSGQMFIDTNFSANGQPRHIFIRFDLDGLVAGKTVTVAELHLTITDNTSVDSGEVWEVTGFDRPSLFATVPSNVGGGPLAPAQGPLVNGQEVVFQLPPSLIVASAPVYLGLRPLSSDAPFYWNNSGTSPPQLHVEYQ